jgi:hypothetical protein
MNFPTGFSLGTLLASLLLLSACGGSNSSSGSSGGGGFFDKMFGGSSGPTVTCPDVSKVADVSRLTRFVPGGHDLTDVSFEAAVGQLGGSCSSSDNSVVVDLKVQFIASRGPANTTRKAPFTFFIAIVDKSDNVLARQEFDSGVEFAGNQTRSAVLEDMEQDIPVSNPQQGNQYRVFVGFVLTPEEIAYNRAHPAQ